MKEKKQSVTKRIAALFLAFAMVIGAAPLTERLAIDAGAAEMPAAADAAQEEVPDVPATDTASWIDAESALSVYQALSGNSDAYIRLTADISEVHGSRSDPTGNVDYTPYWCVMGKGNKVLDLNGHTFSITYALNYDPESTDERRSVYARRGSTLFKVGGGTTFTLCDKNGGGELNYAGVLSDTQSLWRDVRNVIEVSGETGSDAVFIMNGGSIVPGNTGRFKLAGSTDPLGEERIVSGNGVVVGSHSSVTINAGHIEALGQYAREHATGSSADNDGSWIRCACVQTLQYFSAVPEWDAEACRADETTTVYINDCELEGMIGANALTSPFDVSEHNPKVLLRSGTLSNSTDRFFYRNDPDKFKVMNNSPQTATAIFDTAKYNVYSAVLRKNLDANYCNEHTIVNGELIVSPKDKYTPVMWSIKDGTNTSMRMPSYPSEWNSKEDITFCAAFGGTKMSAQNTSVWPYPVPDSSYPTGEGAPEHSITYKWRVYDNSGTSAQSAVYEKTGDSTFSPKNDLSAEDRKNLFTNTIYMMKCVITETYKGQHNYTVTFVNHGYFKVVPYIPPVDVQFELYKTVDEGPGLHLEDTCSPRYLENKKKNGYIGSYDFIIKNVADNYVYQNCTYSTDSGWIMLDETEMKAHTVGIFDISVEVVLYADAEKKNKLTATEPLKKTQTVGWLPKITCPQDDGSYDEDKTTGSIRFVGEGKSATIWLNAAQISGDEWGVCGGGTLYQPLSAAEKYVTINSAKGGGRYFSYVKGKDSGGKDIYYYSPNSIMIQFDDPQYKWDTKGTNIPSKTITTTTTFDATYKLSAEVSVVGKTVSDPRILWTVSDTPDNKDINKPIVNRFKAGTTTVLTEGKSFKSDVQLRDIINVSPQDFPEGNFTFRCELYDGPYNNKANLLSYSDVTVNFVLGYNEYHLWTTRDGEYQEVTDSWLYIDDENSFITIDIKGNPEFTNLGVLKSYTIGDGYEAKDFESSIDLKVTLEETDANGQQKFKFSRKGSGTKTLTLCHPAATEFIVDGVDAPEIGKRIDQTKAYVPDGANYTAKLIWYLNDGADVTSDVFQPNYVYRAYIRFIPNDGVVLPMLPSEYGTSVYDLDSGAVTCLGKFDSGYEIINRRGDSWEGFDSNAYIVKGSMPVADGSSYFGYGTMYKTFDRLIDPDSDDEYISELRFTFDTPVDGDKREDFKISVEPSEAIMKLDPGVPYISKTVTRDRDGSTTFETFEENEEYTCSIEYLQSNRFDEGKQYFFADDMIIRVNGMALSGSAVVRKKYEVTRIERITFSFRAAPDPIVIDSYGFDDIPEAVVGETVSSTGWNWYDDTYRSFYDWFEDLNDNGIYDGITEYVGGSSFTFREGKTYGVHIYMDVDNWKYRFADIVTIRCNGVSKTAEFDGDDWTFADFIMNGKPCTHEDMTLVPAVSSTCSAAGHIAYYVCDKCGKWFREDKVTEITDHESIKLPLAPHTPGEPVKENIVEPKCGTEGGYDMTVYCTVCGGVVGTEHHVVPALGHDWGEWHITVEPTEGTEGTEKRECTRCDAFETRSLEYLGFPVTIGSGKDYETIADKQGHQE